MKKANIELCVVDGGECAESRAIARELADVVIELRNNPGADVLKNVGIEHFVTDDIFLISSDDFVYPDNWLGTLLDQWERVNSAGLLYAMMASPTETVIARHTNPEGVGRGVGVHYKPGPGNTQIMTTSITMVAGTIMDTAACYYVGGFPVYGKTGQGDIAISRTLRKAGYEVGYFRDPVLVHLGEDKRDDYPDYSNEFAADDSIYQAKARKHDPLARGPLDIHIYQGCRFHGVHEGRKLPKV
jgi:glycosyltransferase involved in cell wall biosynthesis